MDKKQAVREALAQMGFPVQEEHETVLTVRYQLSYFGICSLTDKGPGMHLLLDGVFHADNDAEAFDALTVCNTLNKDLMQVKAYLDSGSDVCLTYEFFHFPDQEELADRLREGLGALISAKVKFEKEYRRRCKEADFMRRLDSDKE